MGGASIPAGDYTISNAPDPTGILTLPNSPPGAIDDVAGTAPGLPVLIDVLGNDVDVNGDSIDLVDFDQPTNGAVLQQNGHGVQQGGGGFGGDPERTWNWEAQLKSILKFSAKVYGSMERAKFYHERFLELYSSPNVYYHCTLFYVEGKKL